MGNYCPGSCLPKPNRTGLEFAYLVEDDSNSNHRYPNREPTAKRSLFRRLFGKKDLNKKPVLDLYDGILYPHLTHYSRLNESQRLPSNSSCTSKDIQLQCLDARALLVRTATSTPVSSLDLEWEHETLPISMIHEPSASSWNTLAGDSSHRPADPNLHNTTVANGNSDSDWSRVSSATSLEWDNVQNEIVETPSPISEMDTDTRMLLSEIERLTSKTLSETGRDWFS